MTEKDYLEIIVIPVVLAVLVIAWPTIQNYSRRRAFQKLILRELEEIEPNPESAGRATWTEHLEKTFLHQKIFQEVSENRDFILSLDPDLAYFTSQLWEAKSNKDEVQWRYYLKKLSDPKYDKTGKIGKAQKKWEALFKEYTSKLKQ